MGVVSSGVAKNTTGVAFYRGPANVMPRQGMKQRGVTPKCMGDYTHYGGGIAGLGKIMGSKKGKGCRLNLFAGKMPELLFEAFGKIGVVMEPYLIRYFSDCAGLLFQ